MGEGYVTDVGGIVSAPADNPPDTEYCLVRVEWTKTVPLAEDTSDALSNASRWQTPALWRSIMAIRGFD